MRLPSGMHTCNSYCPGGQRFPKKRRGSAHAHGIALEANHRAGGGGYLVFGTADAGGGAAAALLFVAVDHEEGVEAGGETAGEHRVGVAGLHDLAIANLEDVVTAVR